MEARREQKRWDGCSRMEKTDYSHPDSELVFLLFVLISRSVLSQ